MKFLFLLLQFAIIQMSMAQNFQVGHRQISFVDATRSNRTVTAEVYYPASVAGNNVAIEPGQYPVIIFGHGFVMTWSAYDNVWTNVVPKGYIMVFATTETSISPSHTDFGKDLAFLNKSMKLANQNSSSPFFGSMTSKSAVMGHSMGGGSAFLAYQYDTTFNAIATFAAAETNPSAVAASKNITIPSLIFAGANDCVTPPAQHTILLRDSINSVCNSFISITGASHCQFANSNGNCSFGELTCSPAPTITRAAQHTIQFSYLIPWLNFYLKNICADGVQFQNLITASAGVTSQQNCLLACSTNLNSVSTSNFSLYPNPFSNTTTLKFGEFLENAKIEIYDILGQKVKTIEHISGTETSISKENLNKGIYWLNIIQNDNVLGGIKIGIE